MVTSSGTDHWRKLPNWLSSQERSVVSGLILPGTWQEGRQGTGYEKHDLTSETALEWLIARALGELNDPDEYDAWLLRYPPGSEIPSHTDPAIDGMCHVRFNAIVSAGEGGLLTLDGTPVSLEDGDAYIFRPDLVVHSVAKVTVGPRLLLSVGANLPLEDTQAIDLA